MIISKWRTFKMEYTPNIDVSLEFLKQWAAYLLHEVNTDTFLIYNNRIFSDSKLKKVLLGKQKGEDPLISKYKTFILHLIKLKYVDGLSGHSCIEYLNLKFPDNKYPFVNLDELNMLYQKPLFTINNFTKLLEEKMKQSYLFYYLDKIFDDIANHSELDVYRIYDKISKKLNEYLVDINFTNDMYEDYLSFDNVELENKIKSDIFQIQNDQHEILNTGYPTLDSFFNGGFEKGRLYMIGAKTGYGKSSFLIDYAKHQLSYGRSVYLYTFENNLKETKLRLYSSITNIPMSLLVNSKDVTLKLLNFFNTTKSNIYIKKGMVKNYTTEMIKNNIEMCILKGYRPPDIVIVDYLDLILDTDYKSEERIKLQNISNSLKSLAQELDVVVVTATQLNRESYKKNARVDLNNIAESSGKSHVSDSVLILNSTPEEFNNGILYMYIAKNRHGKSMKTIKFNVDFDCMIFTDSGEFIDGNIDLSNNYMVDLEELEI